MPTADQTTGGLPTWEASFITTPWRTRFVLRYISLLALAILATFALVACGGDDDDDSDAALAPGQTATPKPAKR